MICTFFDFVESHENNHLCAKLVCMRENRLKEKELSKMREDTDGI